MGLPLVGKRARLKLWVGNSQRPLSPCGRGNRERGASPNTSNPHATRASLEKDSIRPRMRTISVWMVREISAVASSCPVAGADRALGAVVLAMDAAMSRILANLMLNKPVTHWV